jgi:transposase
MGPITLLRALLGVENTVVEQFWFESEELVVRVRPKARKQHRCGKCDQRARRYDAGTLGRRWRSLDLGTTKVHLVADVPRVCCREHGVVTAAVPWARHGARFTRAFEDQVTWLATQGSKTAVSTLMRVTWRSVGRIITRVVVEREAARDRLTGLKRIGIDEISYRKGHRYITVVVNHDTGELVWAADGRSTKTLAAFFDLLGEERCAAIELVTRDGAKWIIGLVSKRCPKATQCMDPFHVVQWATGAIDELRRAEWRTLKNAGFDRRARTAKNLRWALLKNPEHLTDKQKGSLAAVQYINKRLYRAYLLKEQLRMVFQASADEVERALEAWLVWARRCRIPEMVALSKSVTRQRAGIIAAVKLRASNATVEAMNTSLRLITRIAYGFHSADAMIALAKLKHSGVCPSLPGRV